jgi:hypothetical protein
MIGRSVQHDTIVVERSFDARSLLRLLHLLSVVLDGGG